MAAQFANPGCRTASRRLRARFASRPAMTKGALLVPQAAVMQVQSMYMLAVVTPDNKAVFRPVKVGERVGTNWIITEGLQPGETSGGRWAAEDCRWLRRQAPEAAPRQGIPVVAKPYVPPAPRRQGATDHAQIFYQSADCGDVYFHPDGAGRGGGDAQSADGAVSQHRRSADPGAGDSIPAPTRRPSRSRWRRRSSSRCRASPA